MHTYIKELASLLCVPGTSPRAINLFTMAMKTGQYRWGRKSKIVAGACLSIALREAKRPDSIRDLAHLLDIEPHILIRTFTSVVSDLKLPITSSNPGGHVSNLHAYLVSILQAPDPQLPAALVLALKSLSLQAVENTANSFSTLLAQLRVPHPLAYLPTPATACAAFILAVEAEARVVLTHVADLAGCLGAKCHLGKSVVMTRYKLIQDEVMKWIEEVHWLDKYQKSCGKRAKVPKRLVVARGLKDVIAWQEQVQKNEALSGRRPTVVLEPDPDQSDSESKFSIAATNHGRSPPPPESNHPPRKRQKTRPAFREATQFLLDPLAAPIPSSFAPGSLDSSASTYSQTPLTSYLLAAAPEALDIRQIPTRLQRLSVARGGAGSEHIGDEELFSEGEWESMLRSEEEMQAVNLLMMEWEEQGVESDKAPRERKRSNGTGRKARDGDTAKEKEAGTRQSKESKRVDMDAVARFMQTTPGLDGGQFAELERFDDEKESEEEDYNEDGKTDDDLLHSNFRDDGEVILQPWRPLSPDNAYEYDQYG